MWRIIACPDKNTLGYQDHMRSIEVEGSINLTVWQEDADEPHQVVVDLETLSHIGRNTYFFTGIKRTSGIKVKGDVNADTGTGWMLRRKRA